MEKKKSFNLIIVLTIVILAVGFGVWKFNEKFKISFVDNKLISCREHIDKDLDMFCDVCHLELPFSNYAEIKRVEAGNSGENKLEIYGYMPKASNANIVKMSDASAISTAKRYKKDIQDEDIVAGFDISLDYDNKKYEPSEYSQKVDVKISNLDLDISKTYALLHIIDDSNYEILPIKEMTKDEIIFTTGSFSTYIIITVGTNTVTFDGENFKVLDTNGNEIKNGATVASGTDFSFNIVPNNYYGITGVTCSTADVMNSYGDIKGKACYISSVSENMTITVTTAIAPSITTHPVSAKVKQGSSTKFSVVANDATTYEWQYRENKSSLWKSVTSTLGSSYTSANFTLTSTGYEVSGYEFRCLVGNANFTAHERVKSDIATVSVAQDDLIVGETPIIMVQPNMDSSKVKVNSGRATYSVTAMGGTDMTFTWQYRENKNELWKTVTSSVASASTSTPSNSTTTKPLKKSTLTTVAATYSLSGYEFRCLVGNTFYTNHDAIKSDIVSISVADDDLTLQGRMLNLKITAQPESQKVKLGDKATFSVTAVEAGTYKWQYLASGEELWKDVTSTMSSTYNKASMVIDTSSMSKEKSLSGARFRCVVSSSVVSGYTKTSDEAILSVVQGTLEKDISYAKVISPKDVTVFEGREASFTAGLDPTVSGLKYEWHEVNGDSDINLATQGAMYMSSNRGKANSTSSEKIVIKVTNKATIAFDYIVSSEVNDKFTVSIEDANGTIKAVDGISGIKDWASYTGEFTPNADGEIILNLSYVKNEDVNEGDDFGAIRNLKCTSEKTIDATCTYVSDDIFKITTPDSDAYDSSYTKTTHTWIADTTDATIFKSNNKGVANSQATASVEISLSTTATLSFDYRVSSEGRSYDWTTIKVVDNSGITTVANKLGGTTTAVTNWQTYSASVTPDSNGKVKILLLYRKDSSANSGNDVAEVRNIKVNANSIVTDNCTFANDNVFTLENNFKKVDYAGANTSTLTIPADLVTLSKNGYKYYCDLGGMVTNKATLTVMEYNITDISSDEITVTLPSEKIIYNAMPQTINVLIKHGDKILVLDTDYTAAYKNNINVGMATLTVTGINLYEGTRDINFLINKRDITIKPKDEHKTYDGTALTSNVAEVSEGSLASGHTVEITTTGSIIDVGNVENKISQLTIKDGSNTDVSENYNITKASGILTVYADSGVNFSITLDKNSYEYDGTAKTPNVIVKAENKVLTKDVDYEVKYTNNVEAGTATVIVTGIGNYKGSAGSSYFTITKRAIEITAGSKSKVYDGTALTCATFSITSSNKLAANQTLSATTFGTITNVGTTENVIVTCKVFASGVDVTSNYSITSKAGTLEITKADVTGSISINGTNVVGETLSVEPDLTPANVALTYEWYYNDTNTTSNGTKISEGKTLTLTDDLAGKYIYVVGKTNSSNYNAKTFEAITTNEKNYSDIVKSGGAPVLMGETSANVYTNGYILGNSSISARRSNVTSIVIKDNVDGASDSTISWDVSKVKDRSVTAWLVPNGSNYTLYIGAEGKIIVSNGYALFAEYSNCTSITGLVNLTTYEVTNMSRMFSNLSKVTSLDVSTLDTASCGDFSYMFNGCNALTSLNVSKFDTIRATNMKMMFNGVSKVNVLNVSGFDTVNVRDMSGMFKGCSSVSGLDVSLFDTTNVENMASMFNGCSSLTSLDVTGFITTSVKSMGRMFKDCSKLTRLDLCSFDLSKLDGSTYLESLNGVNDINEVEMFKGCTSLKSVLLGKHFARINGANMFDGCSALNIIIAQAETPMSLSTDTGLNSLTNAIIYVPNDSSYTNYLKANNYSSVFGDRRIKRMLEVLGEGRVNLYYGDTYTSAGALVAGCAEDSKDIYESYGYTLEVTGLPVDTTVIGIHKVKFNLKYMNTTVDSM